MRCGLVAGQTPGGAPILLAEEQANASPYYESEATRQSYLALHYPDPHADPLAPFLGAHTPRPTDRYPLAVRTLWRTHAGAGPALDVGCACGRMTLELARDFDTAIGLDRSPSLVDAGLRTWREERARYRLPIEGEIHAEHEVALEEAAALRARARLLVGDALALPFARGHFRVVVALNLLDRVPDPHRLLAELTRVTAPGGLLIVGSPYTWLTEFTPRERWLGGWTENGVPIHAAERIRAQLAPRFAFVRERTLLFFIPHHARSGQLGRAHVQVFERRALP